MKKLFLLLVSALLLTSCNFCKNCGDDYDEYYPNPGLTLHQEDLYGTWHSSSLMFGEKEVKQLVFSKNKKNGQRLVNVQLQIPPYTGRYQETYIYVLDGKNLYFKSLEPDEFGDYDVQQFRVLNMYTCELELQDCYTGKKYVIAFSSACNS